MPRTHSQKVHLISWYVAIVVLFVSGWAAKTIGQNTLADVIGVIWVIIVFSPFFLREQFRRWLGP